jgi:4-hydroxybenzoate polyprenyltransferase
MTTKAGTIEQSSTLPPLLVAMRPYQWPKNTLVFAALAFSAGDAWRPGEFDSWWPLLWRSLAIFACWCLASSATYLLNDIQDRDVDRLHPRKQFRPIARGAVSLSTARLSAAVLLVIALPAAFAVDPLAAAILGGYVVVMVGYSYGLKSVAILDVLILCTGVIGRAVAGAVAIDVEISPWLYVCTSFAAFFVASSKRWAEFRQLGAEAASHRPALRHYSGDILSQMLIISAGSALLAYALYTIESANVPANGAMALTIPFVGFALFRYLLLLNGERRNDAPDQIVFTDPQIVIAVFGFLLTAMTVMVLHNR